MRQIRVVLKTGVACITLLVSVGVSAEAPLSFSEKVNKVFSHINNDNTPGCSVGVIERGKFIHKAGYGMANLEVGAKLTPDSVFRMASISKQFTAASVLLLAEEGKISLDEDIRAYLPELPEYDGKVTVRSMIGHYSGMGDFDMISGEILGESNEGVIELRSAAGGPFRLGNQDYLTIKEFYDVVKQAPLANKPDTKFEYSNFAYFLLSMLVEEQSGKTLRQYADEHIFKPLSMGKTFFSDNPVEIVKDRASGYMPKEDGGYVTNMTNLFFVGDGGLHTSVNDFLKWDQNFYQPQVGKNPEEFIAHMNTPNSHHKAEDLLYANGQFIGEIEGRNAIFHSGGWLGASTFYVRFKQDDFSVVTLCNNPMAKAGKYAKEVVKIYFDDK